MATEPATEPVQNGAPVRGKRRTGDWQEYLVLVLLTAAYSIGGGFMFTTGLLQAAWVGSGTLGERQASVVNSVALAMILVPAPAFQLLAHRLGIMPWALFGGIALPLIAALAISSQSSDFPALLVTNGFVVGLAVMATIIACYITLYFYFTDDQIYLFHGVSSSGMGVGILLIATLYTCLDKRIGWRGIQLCEMGFCAVLFLISFTLHPSIAARLGIRTRKDKLRDLVFEDEFASPELEFSARSELNDPRAYSATIEISSKPSTVKTMMSNPAFVLLLSSWALTAPSGNCILVYQPSRMMHLGFSLKLGALSFIGNGVIQILARALSGVVLNRNLITPSRLSATVKLLMVIFTVLSNVLPDLAYQTFYTYYLAVLLGTISTTDNLMVKDCLDKDRETGMAMLSSVSGVGSFVGVQLIGYLFAQWGSYVIQFYAASVLVFFGFVTTVLFEYTLRKHHKSATEELDPLLPGNSIEYPSD